MLGGNFFGPPAEADGCVQIFDKKLKVFIIVVTQSEREVVVVDESMWIDVITKLDWIAEQLDEVSFDCSEVVEESQFLAGCSLIWSESNICAEVGSVPENKTFELCLYSCSVIEEIQVECIYDFVNDFFVLH